MKKFLGHLRMYVFRGLLAMIPIALSVLAVRFIYFFIDKKIINLVSKYIGYSIPGLGILLLLVVLYVIGLLASIAIGKQLFGLIEKITARIPLIRTIYQIGQQVSFSLSLPEKQLFERVVLVDFHGIWAIGFVTGAFKENKTGRQLLRVFFPNVPNPTTGFVTVVDPAKTRDPKWTVEEGIRVVVSGGIIGPDMVD
ncbi:MAG: DUF502 domain-containing protein [Candidatus Omnitrophota bacterium]|nr:DUF502 domain-containing protein [Candidatus Omnitrophota bacterium]MDZ4241428.1 DUF502 domain-containing protein [Candidatus Omnitrophota bacterium]